MNMQLASCLFVNFILFDEAIDKKDYFIIEFIKYVKRTEIIALHFFFINFHVLFSSF